jgi:putative flippase GtrA
VTAGAAPDREGVRFIAFGAFNSLVAWLHPQLAFAIVFAAGVALAYAGNALWVFRAPIRARTAAVYPAIYLVQYLVSAGLLHLLVERAGMGSRLAGFVAMVLVVPLSFVLNRALLRRREGAGP